VESVSSEQPTANATPAQSSGHPPVNKTPRDSAALRRLMEEVRCEDTDVSSAAAAYNRQHNRHNR
jgi:hypothetical protein